MNDEELRFQRYYDALQQLIVEDGNRLLPAGYGIREMMRKAIINAAMQKDDWLAMRIAAKIQSGPVDISEIVRQLRVRVVINRLGE